jgi:hypothetical protein
MLRVGSVVLLVAFVVALVVGGCAPKPKPEAEQPAPPKKTEAAPVAEPAGPAPEKFTWTKSPKVSDIPDKPVTGRINGKPFNVKMVRVEKTDDGPELQFSDQAPDKPTGMVSKDTGAELSFPLPEGKPGEWAKGVDDDKQSGKEHAWFYYQQGGDKGPMSVNPLWGAAIKIDEWTVNPEPDKDGVLGKVKGKVAIVFESMDEGVKDEDKDWVAGTFEGVYYKW